MDVVVVDELREHQLKLTATKISIRSRHSRRTVPTKRSALHSHGCSERSPDYLHAFRLEDLVETVRELGISVTKQFSERDTAFGQGPDDLSCLLGDPLPGWVGSDPGKMNPSAVEFDEEEYITCAGASFQR